ncbi:MAG: hypothetical protein KDB26_15575 [Microthrixaceae bacterium]|nr:hypothetical protein [Microthrixaceae bacterium]
MPVEVRSGRQQTTAIGIGIVALVLAIALAWGILKVASGGGTSTRLRLGDDVFEAGNATRLSKQIKAEGPLLFSDVSGRGQNRPVFINHFGDDPDIRWVAFDAVAPDAPENCFLSWSVERELFEERSVAAGGDYRKGEICRDITFAANGEGLTQYKWTVNDEGLLSIDFRKDPEGKDIGGTNVGEGDSGD